MHCVSVDFHVRPEAYDRFVERTRRQAADSLAAEPGCRVFEVWTDAARNAVHLREVYDDAPAFAAHLETPHFAAYDAEIADMVAHKSVTRWDRKE